MCPGHTIKIPVYTAVVFQVWMPLTGQFFLHDADFASLEQSHLARLPSAIRLYSQVDGLFESVIVSGRGGRRHGGGGGGGTGGGASADCCRTVWCRSGRNAGTHITVD